MSGEERTVVVAMDGSEHAENAFNWYVKNGFRSSDRLVIVYCAEYNRINSQPVTLMSVDPTLVTNLVAQEEEHVKEIAEKFNALVKKHKINGKVVRVNGDAGPGIVDVANREKAVYVVVGSRGLGKIRRTLLGSVSDYVLHHSLVPVIVCKNEND
ncbi:universal stress protein Sll1388-like [Mytilus trossulus]|uniref:universal stress protein Sll1388-like n=1 Tax=Mytilus trossulus TaxID=6551 RepID=UPI003007B864